MVLGTYLFKENIAEDQEMVKEKRRTYLLEEERGVRMKLVHFEFCLKFLQLK